MSPDARDLEQIRLARSNPPPHGDAASAEACRSGEEAFARLYDRHAPVVRALCRVQLRSEEEADDALQETFIRAYRKLDMVQDAEGVRSWLYAIARLVCAERRRSARRRNHHEQRARNLAERTGVVNAAPHQPDMAEAVAGFPAAQADRAEQLDRLSRALEQLPDDERLALHLYYLESDPIAAASECLGVSRSGFYKLLTRGRERLASLMTRAHA